MKRPATVLLAVLLAGACARRVAEPTTPLEWHAVRRACAGEASDDCFWAAIAEFRGGQATTGVARLEATCTAGHGRSCGELASLHRQGKARLPEDGAKARAFAHQGCALGDRFSCHEEGIALFRGLGGPKDLARSTTLYEQACNQGDADACRDFGIATDEGRRDAPDREKAKAAWRRACPASPLACTLLADALKASEPSEARRLHELACELDEKWGCFDVGDALEREGDLPRALRYYRSACARDVVKACDRAARLLLLQGVDAGFPEVERLLLRPAVQRTPGGRARLALARIDRFGRTPEQVAVLEAICHEEGYPMACASLCFNSTQRAGSPACATACRGGYPECCDLADGGVAADGGLAGATDAGVSAP